MISFEPIVEELDLDTQGFYVLADELREREDFVLLDSRLQAPRLGRYSFLCFDPFATMVARDSLVAWRTRSGDREIASLPVFTALEGRLAAYRLPHRASQLPPFRGGAVGYLAYELGRELESLPGRTRDVLQIPTCVLGFYNFAVALDHLTGRVSLSYLRPDADLGEPSLDELRDQIASTLEAGRDRAPSGVEDGSGREAELRSEFTKSEYSEAVRRIKEYVRAGDVYQVNMTQRFSAPMKGRSPWDLYGALMRVNPAPFSAYLGFRDVQVLCSSPELFLRVEGRRVETRPIKGTAGRGRTVAEDRRIEAELLESAKDRAELTMIVDLMRNDLGRVCEMGSVRVAPFPELETYASVHHLVGTVTGTLGEGLGVCDLLRATFPGGSITGAPKIRAMEIIDELERTQRGVYTGSIGYLGFDGDACLNIAIRSIVVAHGEASLNAGGGIVADSCEEREYEECLLKARNLVRALTESEVGS